MPYEVNDTKKEFRRIWDGIVYHMHELSKFMRDHRSDPYFETEEGKSFNSLALNMIKSHVMGCMQFMTMDLMETIENGLKQSTAKGNKDLEEENPDMEEALKELLNKDNKNEGGA